MGTADEREGVRVAVRRLLSADLDRGGAKKVAHYVRLFPGYSDLVEQEYGSLVDPLSETMAGPGNGIPSPSHGDSAPSPDAEYIGPYRVLKEIGRGGMGVVYLAEDTRLRRRVALKVVSPTLASSQHLRTRFRREAELAGRIDHPSICTVFEAGDVDGAPFIAMRFVEGETLAQWVDRSRGREDEPSKDSSCRLPSTDPLVSERVRERNKPSQGPGKWEEILRVIQLIEKAARALHVAHELGLVHRDIKPGNIMVTSAGDPVLLDFGLAREESNEGIILTQTGALMGTPAYMSPEQLVAQRIKLDRRTDVYSLGATLYECLTLRLPFEAPTRDALYQKILASEPDDPRRLNRNISRDLRVVIDTAMEKNRDRRYQTALDLAEDLRRVREMEPIRAKPVGPVFRLGRWAQRQPALAASLSVAFLALTTGLIVSQHLLDEARRERDAKEFALIQKAHALEQSERDRKEKEAALSQSEKERREKVVALEASESERKAKEEALALSETERKEKEAALGRAEQSRKDAIEALEKEAQANRVRESAIAEALRAQQLKQNALEQLRSERTLQIQGLDAKSVVGPADIPISDGGVVSLRAGSVLKMAETDLDGSGKPSTILFLASGSADVVIQGDEHFGMPAFSAMRIPGMKTTRFYAGVLAAATSYVRAEAGGDGVLVRDEELGIVGTVYPGQGLAVKSERGAAGLGVRLTYITDSDNGEEVGEVGVRVPSPSGRSLTLAIPKATFCSVQLNGGDQLTTIENQLQSWPAGRVRVATVRGSAEEGVGDVGPGVSASIRGAFGQLRFSSQELPVEGNGGGRLSDTTQRDWSSMMSKPGDIIVKTKDLQVVLKEFKFDPDSGVAQVTIRNEGAPMEYCEVEMMIGKKAPAGSLAPIEPEFVTVGVKDIDTGTERELIIEGGPILCSKCGGSGTERLDAGGIGPSGPCAACMGVGRVKIGEGRVFACITSRSGSFVRGTTAREVLNKGRRAGTLLLGGAVEVIGMKADLISSNPHLMFRLECRSRRDLGNPRFLVQFYRDGVLLNGGRRFGIFRPLNGEFTRPGSTADVEVNLQGFAVDLAGAHPVLRLIE